MSPQKHAAQIGNAQRSSGPRTEKGKLRSAGNSTRHGLASRKLHLICPRDRADFDRHCAEMLAALAPEGPVERQLADSVVLDQWRLTRARALENEIFAQGYMRAKDEVFPAADTWTVQAKNLSLLTLYEQRINRVLGRNMAELEARQAARKAALPAQSEPQAPRAALPLACSATKIEEAESNSTATGSGFVHSSAATAVPRRPASLVEPFLAAQGAVPNDPGALRSAA